MQVINSYRLRDFWESYPTSEVSLRAWYQLVSLGRWEDREALQKTFPNAEHAGHCTVFDIYGSAYFLITMIDFERRRVAVRDVIVHNEYHQPGWRERLAVGFDEDDVAFGSYRDLVCRFELRPIRDMTHLRQAGRIIDQLLDQIERPADAQDYLDVLSLLIECFETSNRFVPQVSGTEVFRLLCMEHRLSNIELIPLLGSKANAQAVLKGERPLNLRQVTRASRYFKLSPRVFVDPDDLEQTEA